MTDDELRRLIAECEDPDHEQSYLRMPDLAPVLRDALRFRHVIKKERTETAFFPVMNFLLNIRVIHWSVVAPKAQDIREAIDADMEASR